ncbi:hypothetical protein GCM10009113_03260 [Marinobacter szutsaonensis]
MVRNARKELESIARHFLFGGTHWSGDWVGLTFQNCAEPWMAELKRHRDVPQGACFGKSAQPSPSTKGKICQKGMQRIKNMN